ncbi:PREDICTED: uncharacterized protein C12orf43 homolog [Gavialis gangeticus]|uniref:uncharacterized protein C12orf43 homolog n=1 Tax=Gavialis gangeticus TaxID=94835 RepID=UPI00092F21E1|nr:PREDICTED: uncharacterized protein C12orf43 homolog [Gavialis gangeticus]
MAAPTRGSGAGGSDSESGSSSAEDWERFREAAWDPAGQRAATGRPEASSGGLRTDKLPSAQPSLRQRVNDHDQDGNELQTTPEFRAHVAKKLGTMLDSSITVLEGSPRCGWISMQAADSEDDGFRLFSSSVPGDCGKSEPPHSARRRRTSSSSELDSDQEWQRCQEAAVSAADILKQSALPGVSHDYSQAQNQECTEHNQKKKKKRKKKVKGESHNNQQIPEAVGCGETSKNALCPILSNGEHERQEGRYTDARSVKKKKKKKIRKEENTYSSLQTADGQDG